MKRHKIARQRIEAREKIAKALELRKEDYTYAEIAAQLGYAGRQSAWKAVKTAFREITEKPAKELREHMLIRYEAVIEANWGKAMKGNCYACKIVLEALRDVCKLRGLEAPQKLEVNGVDGEAFTFRILRPEFEKPAILPPNDAVGERRRDFQEGG